MAHSDPQGDATPRRPAPRVLVAAGIDPGGGAGLLADTRVLHGAGCWPCGVTTSLTVQDRTGFHGQHPTPPAWIRRSIEAVLANGPVAAIKVGLVPDADTAMALMEALAPVVSAGVPLVLDPVLSATAGGLGRNSTLVAALRHRLVPLATVCTPNAPELSELSGGCADGDGAQKLLELGCGSVALTGGHAGGDQVCDSLWADPSGARPVEVCRGPRLPVGKVHGTGCGFASALAAGLALGDAIPAAFRRAHLTVRAGLEQLHSMGPGDGMPRDLPIV